MQRFVLAMAVLIVGSLAQANQPTSWKSGDGSWADAKQWTDGLPTDLRPAFLSGKCEVTVPSGRHAVGMMRIGIQGEDRVRLRIQGELIARRDFVQIGEHKGGVAEVLVEGGAFHAVSAVYLGGANHGQDRGCTAQLSVRGGSFLARILTLGWGSGSKATLHVEGSKPTSVHLLDGLVLGSARDEAPCESTLAFTLDQRGVTPITVASRTQGLSIIPGAAGNRAHLKIALADVPPRDDVTLIGLRKPARGQFHALPEGAKVKAEFGGREYQWTLTYKGGKSGCDIVLTQVTGHAADAPKTACRERPEPPTPLWLGINSRPALPDKWEPAFAGAEGFGSMAKGGRGGSETLVTNLNDSGPGSLRAAVTAKGSRIVKFQVGGTIELKTPITIREPYLTLDGSDAPEPGITLRRRGISVTTHDVILRHIRIRLGVPSSEWEGDCLEFDGAQRCIADHLSLSWATDETLSVVGLSDCITVQWCILAEPLNDRKHAYGSIIGGERTTWHHNLYAHAVSRVPRFAAIAQADFRNNVLYDWGQTAGYGQFERVNYVANFLKPGPSTNQRPLQFHNGDSVVAEKSLHLSGNVLVGHKDVTDDNSLGIGYEREVLSVKPFDFPPVATEEAAKAYERVLEKAGAVLPARDQADERVVRQTRDRTGKIIARVP